MSTTNSPAGLHLWFVSLTGVTATLMITTTKRDPVQAAKKGAAVARKAYSRKAIESVCYQGTIDA